MHGEVSMGGPVFWFAEILVFGSIALSLYVLFDSLRAKRVASVAQPGRLVAYRVLQGTWILSLFVLWIVALITVPPVPLLLVVAVLFIASIIQGFAYLLRVVHPPIPRDARTGIADAEDAIAGS